jgi:hypothetical protein
MSNAAPSPVRSLKSKTFLRIPVLLAVGLMTMGSGMGNPGCGSSSSPSSEPECEGGCAISGSYTLQLADTSPVGADCEALGLGLPQGPLVVALSGTTATATLDGVNLSTPYHGEPSRRLNLAGTKALSDTDYYTLEFVATVAAPAPRSDTDPSTLEGEYKLESYAQDRTDPKCVIRRVFTATR